MNGSGHIVLYFGLCSLVFSKFNLDRAAFHDTWRPQTAGDHVKTMQLKSLFLRLSTTFFFLKRPSCGDLVNRCQVLGDDVKAAIAAETVTLYLEHLLECTSIANLSPNYPRNGQHSTVTSDREYVGARVKSQAHAKSIRLLNTSLLLDGKSLFNKNSNGQ